jgi:hypothetical protein
MKWLVSQVCYPGYGITVDELLDRLEDEFEKAKQNFDDRLEYDDIPLPGRPFNLNRPDRGLIGSAFRLSRCVSQSQLWDISHRVQRGKNRDIHQASGKPDSTRRQTD